jgi:hypothetical protein
MLLFKDDLSRRNWSTSFEVRLVRLNLLLVEAARAQR